MRRVPVVCSLFTVLLAFLLALAPVAVAELPPQGLWEWTAPYQPATPLASAQLLAAGPDGSVYVAGDGQGTSEHHWVVSRVDAAGAEVWSKTTLGPGGAGARPSAVATDAQRNLIVAGYCSAGEGDVFVVKYRAADGKVLWQKRWGGSAGRFDSARAVTVDRAGNVFVAGYVTPATSWAADALALKYDAAGRLKWKYVLATDGIDRFAACGIDGSGNLYVTGVRNDIEFQWQLVTVKIGPAGSRLWQRTVAGLGLGYDGRQLWVRGQSVTVVGCLVDNGARPVILRYTLAGKRTWAISSRNGMEWIKDAAVDGEGRVYVIGGSTVWFIPGGITQVGTLQVYEPGAPCPIASEFFSADLPGDDRYPTLFERVALDSAGRVYCAGTMYSASGESSAMVARWPAAGTVGAAGVDKIWLWDGPAVGYDRFFGILRAGGDAVYVAGEQTGAGGTEAILHRLQTGDLP